MRAQPVAPVPGVRPREALAVGAVLVLAALLLSRRIALPSEEFDEQVYLASADLLQRGFALGVDVFTSQPPLFLTALDWAYGAVGGSVAAMRALAVGVTLAGALAGWALVRRISGPRHALAAVALLVLAPGVVDAAAVVSADVPCMALGTGALLAGHAARRRAVWGLAAGALLACALLVKLLAAPFVLALLVAAVVDRPPARALAWFAAGACAVGGAMLFVYWGALGGLWDGAVDLHLAARAEVKITRSSVLTLTLLIVGAYAGLLGVLAAGVSAVGRAGLATWARDRADLLALFAAGLALCLLQRPLLHHHLVILAWPLALLAGSSLVGAGPRRIALAAGAAGVLVLPLAVHGRGTLGDRDRDGLSAAAALVRERTPPDATVVGDLPLVALLAGRQPAAATVDPSYVRVSTGSLGREEILRAARRADAVVVGRSFARVPGLERALAARLGPPARAGDDIRVYTSARSARRAPARRGR